MNRLRRLHSQRKRRHAHRGICVRSWAVVGLVWYAGVCAEASMFHTNPAKLFVIGRVVLRIVTGRGSNALARREHVVRLIGKTLGRRTVAYDATRRAPLAATAPSAALVTPDAPNGPCRAILTAVSPESGLRCASDKEIHSSDKDIVHTVGNDVGAIET